MSNAMTTNGYETMQPQVKHEPWLGTLAGVCTLAVVVATYLPTEKINPTQDQACAAVAVVCGLALLVTHARRLRGLRAFGRLTVVSLLSVPVPLIFVGLKARADAYFAHGPTGPGTTSMRVQEMVREHYELLGNLGTGVALLGLVLLVIGIVVKLKAPTPAS